MPATWNADRRRSHAQADFWNPTPNLGDDPKAAARNVAAILFRAPERAS
jgi:hypothetical protein